MKKLLIITLSLILCLAAAGCDDVSGLVRSTETALPRPTRTATPPLETIPQQQGIFWQSVLMDSYGVTIGSTASVYLYLWPASFIESGGGWVSNSLVSDQQASGKRFCLAVDAPCAPQGDWLPFENSYEMRIPVDWEGDRLITIAAEFRLDSGETLLSMNEASTDLLPISSTQLIITGLQPTETPDISATLLAYPVTGEAIPEQSIIGGTAGSKLDLTVHFSAQSPYGQVTEMRLGGWLDPAVGEIDAAWEPFVEEKTFQVSVPLNWSTFYLSVQFRDAKGNLSQVYRVEVAVEGSPVMPTP